MNFTKTFVIIFLVISLLTTTYVIAEMNKNNWKVDEYVASLELLSQVNESTIANWMIENARYKDFHFVDKETLRSYRWMKSIWPTHSIKKTDGINPYGKIPMLKPTKQKPKRVTNRRCDPFPCK